MLMDVDQWWDNDITLAFDPTTDCAIQKANMKVINKYSNAAAIRNCTVWKLNVYH